MRNDEPCDDKCGCVDCRNPLNPEEIEKLIRFATEALEKYKELLKKLAKRHSISIEYKLPR